MSLHPQFVAPPPPASHHQQQSHQGLFHIRGALFPRRREHVAQPPALVTSLGGAHQFPGLGVTGVGGSSSNSNAGSSSAGYLASPPVSTSSLSGPFSAHHNNNASGPSPYLASPGAASRDTSPMAMASRWSNTTGFSVMSSSTTAAYNPQEWGPVAPGSSPLVGQGAFTGRQIRVNSRLSNGKYFHCLFVRMCGQDRLV